MDETNCEYCYPEKPYHIRRKVFSLLDNFILKPFIFILSKIFLLSENDFIRFENLLNKLSIIVFQKLKFFTKTNIIDRNQFSNTVLALWDEAHKRGLELYNFKEPNLHTLYFMLIFQREKYYFMQTPISLIYQKNRCIDNDIKYDNKWTFKKKLLINNIPCPIGKIFISKKNAYRYGVELGFPLVVKPVAASLSIHSLCNIQTLKELEKAIRIVKQVDFQVLIEQHIPGNVYRSLIINKVLIACVMRQPGSVIGDGISTLQELIDKKNKAARKDGKGNYRYQIKTNSYLTKIIETQGVTLNTVISNGQQIFISKKVTMSSGAETSNVIHLMHPENRLLLERVHGMLKIPLTGLDFICQDISLPWYEQQFGIIENNSFPFLDLHLTPSDGKEIEVPRKIWDYVLDVLGQVNNPDSIKNGLK